ncbi:MAG: hypothetical protein D4Q77_01980 [Methanothrix sp.]|nr:MAG: hypothetical protein D4Q77_01980 [Methanothrix sp.]
MLMKAIALLLASIILLCSTPALAPDGLDEEYTCWICPNPYCGYVTRLNITVDEDAIEYITTLGEVMSLDPDDEENYCPRCGTYGSYFVLVSCSDYEYADYYEYHEDEYTTHEGYDGGYEAYEEDTLESDYYDEPAVNESAISYRILMAIPPQDYNEPEFDIPLSYFEDQGFEVLVASKCVNTATGNEGAEAEVDLNVSDADASEYVAVVFIGGMGVDDLRLYDDEDYLNLARSAGEEDKIVGGICLSSKILANAGLYQGKNATVCGSDRFHNPIDYIQERGAFYVAQPVVQDGKTISGWGPSASQSFAEAIVEAIRAPTAEVASASA